MGCPPASVTPAFENVKLVLHICLQYQLTKTSNGHSPTPPRGGGYTKMYIPFPEHNIQPISVNTLLLTLLFRQPSPLRMEKLKHRRAVANASSDGKQQGQNWNPDLPGRRGLGVASWTYPVGLTHRVCHPGPPAFGPFLALGCRNGWRHFLYSPRRYKKVKLHLGEAWYCICLITASQCHAHSRCTIKLIGGKKK